MTNQTKRYSNVVETAREYYNSEDADNFYYHVWGGEDIHIGLYTSPTEAIATASRRTVERMASMLGILCESTAVLDIGSGFGGSARFLASQYDCHVTALNLSETENQRARRMAAAAGLAARVEVIDGSFESLPFSNNSFDVVWSQDAMLHSGERAKVFEEVARVLKPGGSFLFTDPMQADDCPPGVLQPVLDRIHLASLGSVAFYRQAAVTVGLDEVAFVDLSEQLPLHYGRVHDELVHQRVSLRGKVSDAYIERMLTGLRHWQEAGENGYLAWGILHFAKP